MRVQLVRHGGFTGIPMRISLDAEQLSGSEGLKLQNLLQAARFFELPARVTAPVPGADQFEFMITVEQEGRTHTVNVQTAALWPEMEALIEWLQRAGARA